MFIIVFKYLLPKGYRGITLFPFIFLLRKEDKRNEVLVNHERIHIRQQLELLILPFFVWYGVEFLVRFVQYRNRREAYHNISFEREAYAEEKDLDYLKKRSFWYFLKFI
ncbi:hypothetical protein [Flavobacterium okayamense]|uniref:Peptidase M56 domain-containing protein n=1 Tax=Flavobacterium okayamense TaxID=2830782 RepID=A0ABN6HVD6_9FLAO|nr:hypothetical protein [Flavobacterium okayamense]BCY28410.1 hypothetical protein KK2020170_12780 [Flavobacterium okayamense]